MNLPDIAGPVVRWQAEHGRQHLPWQHQRDPYRVWLSEIMLQQTQVATVLGYYQRFLQRFPDVAALAAAPLDDVLALWSGLGYYARARYLHRCAQAVVADHGGQFPETAAALALLPGIGRSTAGAIAAFCFSERVPILDANVRRVLTRVLAFPHDVGQSRGLHLLWEQAQALLPQEDLHAAMPRYTQGLMDLGAQICLPRKPQCDLCPLQPQCQAARSGTALQYPIRSRKLQRQAQRWWLLLQRNADGDLWLQQRPSSGIWAALWCPPVLTEAPPQSMAQAVYLPPLLHVLTHRDLYLHPVLIDGVALGQDRDHAPPMPWPAQGHSHSHGVHDDLALPGRWCSASDWADMGLPAPVRKLLADLPAPD